MPRLFNKSMQAHERAYRETRADEAANDMVLSVKVAAFNNLEEAQDKAANDIAAQYSKFLKALQVKEVPLVSTDAGLTAKDKLEKAKVEKGIADWNSRTAVSGSTGPTASLTDISRYSRDARTAQLVADNTRTQISSDAEAFNRAFTHMSAKMPSYPAQVNLLHNKTGGRNPILTQAQYANLQAILASNNKYMHNIPRAAKRTGTIAKKVDIIAALAALRDSANPDTAVV